MNVLIAPDSFKGSISSIEIINILRKGLSGKYPDYNFMSLPIADGGEGSIDVLQFVLKLDKKYAVVSNPVFKKIETYYLIDAKKKTAYIEMAKASGLELLNDPDVLDSSSIGTGELIKNAIENGIKKIILFIGGSATNDAGLGIAHALGYRFLNIYGHELKPIGRNLKAVYQIEGSGLYKQAKNVEFTIASDVNNPLFGLNGAAHVYAPQKGASVKDVIFLDEGLQNISKIFNNKFNVNVADIKGSGAAGGIGAGMIAFFDAKLVSGSGYIFQLLKLKEKIKINDVIITGEGKIDSQTVNDKLIFKLAALSKKYKKKVIAVCGFFDGDNSLCKKLKIDYYYSLANEKKDISDSIKNVKIKLREVSEIIEL